MYVIATADGTTRYVGLAEGVGFRVEIGIAFVDDGRVTYRVRQRLFERLLDSSPGAEGSPTPEEAEVLAQFPSVFVLYESREEAVSSLDADR